MAHAQAQTDSSSLLDQEQFSDGSDLYILASDDDPYFHFQVV